ncbi:hypothetical protein SSSV4_ORF64 [Sulfolobus spindle-shaped virus 4]|uniref:Uncharacterized protein n=2 Tax=Alphafusellovirus TaxID=10475 RepID=A8TKI3_9VIRU|nr:hypothetical protein SSSV4_ORF64 [Sulfolobus spindle-shaped virus 4]YP_002221484.1 hypothetical protein SSSV5_gp19 [Sulfolobus spindle-shaped virus 5]ABV26206.1 hypothetical protein [Sulfolobus spindle-shaped virus 4]ABV26240.1 hypothetical protein [Sulfolobus spindle-shaped virus 5]
MKLGKQQHTFTLNTKHYTPYTPTNKKSVDTLSTLLHYIPPIPLYPFVLRVKLCYYLPIQKVSGR